MKDIYTIIRKVLIMTLLLPFVGVLQSQAQVFAPIGAEWHYEYSSAVGGPLLYVGYEQYTVVGDTMIQGRSCMVVESTGGDSTDCENMGKQSHFFSGDDDHLLWYNEEQGEFTVLHDYSAQAGGGWTVSVNKCSFDVAVDSVSTQMVGAEVRRVLYIHDDNGYYNGCIVEGVGHLNCFLPKDVFWECDGIMCDGIQFTKLRCFYDGEETLNFTDMPCDTTYYAYWESLEESMEETVTVYPTMASDFITLRTASADICGIRYQLIDETGRVYNEDVVRCPEMTIPLADIPSGFYLIRIFDDYGTIQTNKLVKE